MQYSGRIKLTIICGISRLLSNNNIYAITDCTMRGLATRPESYALQQRVLRVNGQTTHVGRSAEQDCLTPAVQGILSV